MDIKVFEYFISQIFAAAIKTARTKEEWRGEGGEVSELGGKNISWPHTLARLMARLAYLAARGERVLPPCRGRVENRASRKTARYVSFKCSREAH